MRREDRDPMGDDATRSPERTASALQVFLGFLYIGLTAFGGPVAHRARFRELLVSDSPADPARRELLRALRLRPQVFEDLWVFANLLPGPSSSQVAMAIGRIHAGTPGTFAAWAGFALPTAALATAGGVAVYHWRQSLPPGLIAGLLIAVFVVILNAVRSMLLDHQTQLAPTLRAVSAALVRRNARPGARRAFFLWIGRDGLHAAVAAASCAVMILAMHGHPLLVSALALAADALADAPSGNWARQNLLQTVQFAVILLGLGVGLALFPGGRETRPSALPPSAGSRTGPAWLILFVLLLAVAALTWNPGPDWWLADLAARFYRVGALVFGGGHVVLPLLEGEIVATGRVERETFLIGYGAVQALPGPLFAFAGFLGTVASPGPGMPPGGWTVGLLCVAAIFAPSLLLVSGLLGVFLRHRDRPLVRKALGGANAAVVGILGAALWPIWAEASAKWYALGLAAPGFWLATLLLLGLLAGIPLPARKTRFEGDALRGRSAGGLRLVAELRSRQPGEPVARIRLPAPLLVVAAALGGWLLGG